MKTLPHILLVDDEEALLELVASYLKTEYEVTCASSGDEALSLLARHEIDLIVLDVMMPGMDGFTTCEKIRAFSSVPIVMLTARSSEEDKIKGLKIGADDYVVKPFSPRELMARIEAALRRSRAFSQPHEVLRRGPLLIDKHARELTLAGTAVTITRREYDLLVFLIEHEGQVFTREQLYDRIWGIDSEYGTLRTVDTHIKTLRLKLKSAGAMIKTVWGIGYKFEGQS
ncbi:response regulator transcription factor [Alkalihalobacillus oceani]|uniref:response regulator transcription factor n=1 Tax=Halalkalibacter oceani TaxID=1653776 RepID=UPI002040DA00|nr:response regulator transcription factor [Halalkalibacter oceani]MCM3761191.1 response regulator transcription factor [Halalkalibacter oceani]